MKTVFSAALVIAAVAMPGAVMAHPGDHGTQGLLHFLSGPDHLALLVVAAAGAGAAILRHLRRGKTR